jgi:phospholipid transport system substrate-binding protein
VEQIMTIGSSVAAPSPLQRAGDPQHREPGPALLDAPFQPGKPLIPFSFRLLLTRALYLAAILLLPGALFAVVLLWWLDRRRTRTERLMRSATAVAIARSPAVSKGSEPMRYPPRAVIRSMIIFALVLALAAPLAVAQDVAPDVLVKAISRDVIAAIRQDKDVQAGNSDKIVDLVETKIVPHFDFTRTTQIAMGIHWRRATPVQQEQLTREFRKLLLRTYSGALANYRDRIIEYKSARVQPGDAEVTVLFEVRQPGTAPIEIGYQMEKTASGWKIYDLKIGGVRLATTYRDTFGEEVRNQGIDGLIDLLSSRNRRNGA